MQVTPAHMMARDGSIMLQADLRVKRFLSNACTVCVCCVCCVVKREHDQSLRFGP